MYANGLVPFAVLVHITANIWLPPGTAARFAWAFDMAYQKYGIRLRFTPGRDGLGGWNGFRPLSAQKLYRKHYGIMAAVPGFSTHGGNVNGREVFAADIDNWAELGWARFAAIMRLAGLAVDFVKPREQWHVGDFNNPWWIPAFASGGGGSAVAPPPAPKPAPPESEEDDMPRNTGVIYRTPQNAPASQQRHVALIHNTGSGFEFEFDNGVGGGPFDGGFTTKMAVAYDTPSWVEISEGAVGNIKRSLASVRANAR